MLLALLPQQVASHWDSVKRNIMQNAPINTCDGPVDYNRVLEMVLGGKMQLWASSPDGVAINGFCLTQILNNYPTGQRVLHLYAIFGRDGRRITRDEWIDGYNTLRVFAESKGCSRITGYSNHPGLIRLAERLGLDTGWRFISVEV